MKQSLLTKVRETFRKTSRRWWSTEMQTTARSRYNPRGWGAAGKRLTPKASKDWSCREGLSGGSCDLGRGAPALPDVAPPGERDLSRLPPDLLPLLPELNQKEGPREPRGHGPQRVAYWSTGQSGKVERWIWLLLCHSVVSDSLRHHGLQM